MAEKAHGMIKVTDYAFEQSSRNAADVVRIREQVRVLGVVTRDLVYILKELIADNMNPAHEGYLEALEGHLGALEMSLGEIH